MSDKIKIAVVGLGGRGSGLIPGAILPACEDYNIEIAAVYDPYEDRTEAAVKSVLEITGKAPVDAKNYQEILDDPEIKGVIISSAWEAHIPQAIAAMKAGKYAAFEVGGAYSLQDCWDLVNTVKKTGAKYQLAEQTRYWHFIAQWRKMVAEGKIGKVFYAEGEYLHYENTWDYFRNKKTGARIWTADPSYHNNPDWETTWRYRAFMDPIWYLPHELSPLLSITGGRIEKVSCLGTRQGSYCHEGFAARDLECALMYNSNDTIFSLRAGFTAPYGRKAHTSSHWYQLKGSEGSLEWARSTEDVGKMYTREEGWSNHPEWGCADPEAAEVFKNANHGGADFYPIYHFIDAILNDKTPPMDVYKAVETAAPAIMAYESARQNGALLEVPDFRDAK